LVSVLFRQFDGFVNCDISFCYAFQSVDYVNTLLQ
jgi:hypothetical protein